MHGAAVVALNNTCEALYQLPWSECKMLELVGVNLERVRVRYGNLHTVTLQQLSV